MSAARGPLCRAPPSLRPAAGSRRACAAKVAAHDGRRRRRAGPAARCRSGRERARTSCRVRRDRRRARRATPRRRHRSRWHARDRARGADPAHARPDVAFARAVALRRHAARRRAPRSCRRARLARTSRRWVVHIASLAACVVVTRSRGASDASPARMRLACCLVLTACSQSREPPPASDCFATERADAHEHVKHKLDLARAVEMLLVRGDLAEARPLARMIAESPEAPDERWRRAGMRLRNEAAGIAYANDLDEALRAASRLARACAECHEEAGGVLSVVPRMRSNAQPRDRHVWATDRLWEGMIGNADDPWLAALDSLARGASPLATHEAFARDLQELAIETRAQWTTEQLGQRAA